MLLYITGKLLNILAAIFFAIFLLKGESTFISFLRSSIKYDAFNKSLIEKYFIPKLFKDKSIEENKYGNAALG